MLNFFVDKKDGILFEMLSHLCLDFMFSYVISRDLQDIQVHFVDIDGMVVKTNISKYCRKSKGLNVRGNLLQKMRIPRKKSYFQIMTTFC